MFFGLVTSHCAHFACNMSLPKVHAGHAHVSSSSWSPVCWLGGRSTIASESQPESIGVASDAPATDRGSFSTTGSLC